ncbi:carbon storage regulator [Rubinisphaera margarita]|uniref:carbon storage regulator n=1 Tax=Rubinisphaera margarita TaxID=2909586 RepID=UPI001EE9451C|nr:carbon storage regulator [Rubinisphaera margarita]MCG6157969.1 carbon storage regulator [Rubinisphaera margarita]
MLVLTRKKSQLIQIGDNIVIKVIRTGPGSVKLGIDAPSHVRVMRGELDEKLSQNYELVEAGEAEGDDSASATTEVECRRGDRVEDEEVVSPKATSRKNSRASVV